MRSAFHTHFAPAFPSPWEDARRFGRAGEILALLALLALPLTLAACQTAPSPALKAAAQVEIVQEPRWRSAASAEDAARIDGVHMAWDEALAQARRRGFSRQVAAEGRLLEPNAALARPAPTPGNYMCRWIRFGSRGARARAFTAFNPFFCHVGVSDDALSLTKQTGSDRPTGYLFDDNDPLRMIFLGSLAPGNAEPLAYGVDPARDMVGVFERIGPLRFRLVVPRPRSGSILDVLELTPAPVQNSE